MSFLMRSIVLILGAAFLFATANLFVSGVPDTDDLGFDIASGAPAPQPGRLRDFVSSLISPPSSARSAALPVISSAPPRAPAPTAVVSDMTLQVEADWRAWMATNGVSTGSMVVLLPDGTMHRAGLGRATNSVVPVADLSMAITGICLDIVLQNQGRSWYTSLRDIAPQLADAGLIPNAVGQTITLAALANHTSGLAPDLTQSTMATDLTGPVAQHNQIAGAALQADAMQGRPHRFFYNASNYAVLGVAIEALTGQSYGQACMDRVLTPAGVSTAAIQGIMGARSSFGGWEISAEDYAHLAQHWLTSGNARIDASTTRPMHDYYALGYRIHGAGVDARVTHTGASCAVEGNHGALLHARGDGTVFVANWSGPCLQAQPSGLDAAISAAMR